MNNKIIFILFIMLFLILSSCDESVIVMVIDDTPLDGRGGGIFAIVSDVSGEDCIYVINADGSGMRKVTTEEGIEHHPRWSPDGMKLSFAADYEGDNNIYVVDVLDMLNGTFSEPMRLTNDGGFVHSWSPDGNYIAFEIYEDRLYIMNSDGTNEQAIPSTENYRQPSWSPDGTRFVCKIYSGNSSDLMIMNRDGSNRTVITTAVNESVASPAWSLDGLTIAFDRYDATYASMALIDVDGTNPRWLPQNRLEYPSFSPDSQFIVCESDINYNIEQVYIIAADGSSEEQITNGSYNNGQPVWRPE